MSAPQHKLELRQTQTLKMTQNLQEAIHLLQIPSIELQSYLAQHLEANPLLELDEPASDDSQESFEEASDISDDAYCLDATYADRQDFIAPERSGMSPLSTSPSFSDTPEESDTFLEDLLHQAAVVFSNTNDLKIAEYFIYNLDEKGFLSLDLEAFSTHSQIPLKTLEPLLKKLQSFDPPGLFARSLQECLSLQLKALGKWDTAFESLLNHLDLVAKQDWSTLKKQTQLTLPQIQEKVLLLKTLKPYPIERTDGFIQTRIPDLIINKKESALTVHLNHEALPKIRLNKGYLNTFAHHTPTKQEASYFKAQEREGSWLLSALEKRADTLLKLGHALLKKQRLFFNHGLRHLKPLTLSEIAQEIDVHESTVSRIVKHKYVQCPQGIFELKFFFSSGVSASTGQEHSSKYIQDRLLKLIESEPTSKPYSDEALTHLFKEEGISIARRTVTKYREKQNIPSASQRKRLKNPAF